MKLCTFAGPAGPHVGLVLDFASPTARLLDLTQPTVGRELGFMPNCLEEVIAMGLERAGELAERRWPGELTVPLDSAKILAPCITRAKIVGVARNYHSALVEAGEPVPEVPVLFAKLPNTVIGPGDSIGLGEGGRVAYEGEIGLVVGKRAKAVSLQEAAGHIAGFTLINDVTSADFIARDGNLFRAKNVDSYCPMGPFFVSADELTDPHAICFALYLDGKRMQEGDTGDMVYDMFQLVHQVSRIITLEPGDVIATGTPAGAAAFQTPPMWLQSGMEIRITAEGFGELINTVA
jgi:2-keto-4-pentenoate hydratase/2-oxohepta-3-ene-1,7-dioic acid hydratase in catechol pathway